MKAKVPAVQHACPRDRSPMRSHRHTVVGAWLCGQCEGLWLPGVVVARELGHLPLSTGGTVIGDPTAMCCPEDGASLRAVYHRGVEVDCCPLCRGVWFDAGEIERIGRLFGHSLEEVASGVVTVVDPDFPFDVAGEALSAIFEFLAELFLSL